MVGKSFSITGDGAVHTFSYALAQFLGVSDPGFQVKWFQVTPRSGNAATMRVGGNEVTSTVGYPVAAGGSQFLPDISEVSSRYHLAQEYYYLAVGDFADCLYGVD